MFRKRKTTTPPPSAPQPAGGSPPPGYPGGAPAPAYPAAQPWAGTPVPAGGQAALPARPYALLLLSQDFRRAEELLRVLDHNAGKGRYTVTWVGTIEDLAGALAQGQFDACLLDFASPQIGRLEGNGYRIFGALPYLAILTTPSLSDGDPLLQELDVRGYYAYVGYPFDGPAVDQVLRDIFRQAPQPATPPPPAVSAPPPFPPPMAAPGTSSPEHLRAPAPPTGYPTGALDPTLAGRAPQTGSGYTPAAMPQPMPPGVTGSLEPTLPARMPPAAGTAVTPPAFAPQPAMPAAPAVPPAAPPANLPVTPPAALAPMPPQPAPAAPSTLAMAPAPQATPPASPAPPPAPPTPQPQAQTLAAVGPGQFAIEPQIVRQRGLFVCWSPFDGAQRTAAALNLATALAFGGFRTLVGELRRPAGPLRSYLQLTEEELSRSLLAAAHTSERLMTQRGYVIDQDLLENSLLNAIPLDPHSDDSPEVHFFLSGPAASPQLLFNAPALDPSQSAFVPELLQMIRNYWDFAFIIVGSSPVDKLHWQAFRACDRLLIFLPPDPTYLTQAQQILPTLLRAAKISPANVDVILTQADRGVLAEQLEPILRFIAKQSPQEGRNMRSLLSGAAARRHPPMEEKYLRAIERQLRKIAEDTSIPSRIEEDVKAMLKACGLEDKLAGVLPDAVPLMRSIRRESRLLLPALMQREYANSPYAVAIRHLLGAWVQVASSNVSHLPGQHWAAQ